MILPLRVLGSASMKRTSSGFAREPISFTTHFFNNQPGGHANLAPRFRAGKDCYDGRSPGGTTEIFHDAIHLAHNLLGV
jgi:hypothetical protein